MNRKAFAPGKLILSGEYAVVFGYPGIAVPLARGVEAVFERDASRSDIELKCEEFARSYAAKVVRVFENDISEGGTLAVGSKLPFGKGLGSSTAFVVAIVRALFGENVREKAEQAERVLNPTGSGIDFETIWNNAPLLFRKDAPSLPASFAPNALRGAFLIDTGAPNEPTHELVAWMQSRRAEMEEHLKAIGACTERILKGEPLASVMRDHHKAQIALGVVPPVAAALIAKIETSGGAAKVVGAGARTGDAGMVVTLGNEKELRSVAAAANMPILPL